MNMNKEQYKKYAAAHAPKSPVFKNSIRAFFVGGIICCGAQALTTLYTRACGIPKDDASALTSTTLVFLAVLLTAFGVFDKIARFAGGGTLVPITGFANSVASPAIDSRSEGLVLGIGAKIFTVAGPVLLYGTLSGTLYGVIYWICKHLFPIFAK